MNTLTLSVISAILFTLAAGIIATLFILKSKPNLYEKYSMMLKHKCNKCGKQTKAGALCMHCGEALGQRKLPLKIIAMSVAGVMFVGGAGAGTAALWKNADRVEISAVAVPSSAPSMETSSAPPSSMETSSAEPSSVEALSSSAPPSSMKSSSAPPSSTPPVKARYEMKWIKEPQYDYNIAYTNDFLGTAMSHSTMSTGKYSEFYSALFAEKNGKYGVIDLEGNIIHPLKDSAVGCSYCAENGVVEGTSIEDRGHDGFINLYYNSDTKKFTDGYVEDEIKIPSPEHKLEVFAATSNNPNYEEHIWGYLGEDGSIALEGIYSAIYSMGDGKLAAQLPKGKWAIFSTDGKQLSDFIYDRVGDFSEGYSAVSVDGKFGYIDNKLNVVIPPTYEQLSEVVYGRCYAKQDGLLGVAELVDNQSKRPNQYEAVKWKTKYADIIYNILEEGVGGLFGGELSELSIGDVDNDGVSEIYCSDGSYNSNFYIIKNGKVIELFSSSGAASGGVEIFYNPNTKQIATRTFGQGGQSYSCSYEDMYGKRFFSYSYEYTADYMQSGQTDDPVYDLIIDEKTHRDLTTNEMYTLINPVELKKVGGYRSFDKSDFEYTIILPANKYAAREQIAELLDKIDS